MNKITAEKLKKFKLFFVRTKNEIIKIKLILRKYKTCCSKFKMKNSQKLKLLK
jgi:hypothetical protein